MNEATMIDRLRSLALCDTSHPADAAGALIGAAAAVLAPRFNKYQVANMIASAVFDALALGSAIDRGTLADREELSEPEMTRLFVKRGAELTRHANQAAIGAAMLAATFVTLESSHGTLGACAAIETAAGLARRGELLSDGGKAAGA